MRWRSDPETVQAARPTVLALLETFAAIGAMTLLVVWTDSAVCLAVSVFVAPLLLLRTAESTATGLKLIGQLLAVPEWIFEYKERALEGSRWKPKIDWIFALFVLLPGNLIASLLARIVAAVICAIRHPLRALAAVPENWFRVVCCLDVGTAPELVPGLQKSAQQFEPIATKPNWLLFGSYLSALIAISSRMRWFLKPILLPPLWLFFVLLFAPPLLYRWSLKATSIVYSPFLWVVKPARPTNVDLGTRLRLYVHSDLIRLGAVYSAIVLVGLGSKVVVLAQRDAAVSWWNETNAAALLAVYWQPSILPIWQIAMGVNAALLLGVLWYFRSWLQRLDHARAPIPARAADILTWTSVVRRLLSLYTIICTGYLTVRAAIVMEWPRLGKDMFPWQ